MSSGLDAMADNTAPDYLMNILESKPEMTYQGQNFAGDTVSASTQNLTGSEEMSVPGSIGNNVDSINTLGASTAPMNVQSSQRN